MTLVGVVAAKTAVMAGVLVKFLDLTMNNFKDGPLG